ncbi:MAG TPA: SRPBCC family protein [Solirubrobacteraceae bacterium]|nr:SRPBCC family protein [Solirubrobacteraceae bacterium]
MAKVEESIEVDVPVRTAYDQWTQFQEFPQFMEGVEEVRQLDDTHLHWRTKVAGREKSFRAKVTEQIPDERIAWASEEGARQAGVVTFHRLDDRRTRIMLQLEAEPEGIAEKAGDALGLLARRVAKDLENFKRLIESRGQESGAWRGVVSGGGRPEESRPWGPEESRGWRGEESRAERPEESRAGRGDESLAWRGQPQVGTDERKRQMNETPLEVARLYTRGLKFPATKEQVLESFQRQGAPHEAVEIIRSKNHPRFSGPNEVMVYLRRDT